MILTGKCREGFEDWYNSNIGKKINVGHLSLYTLSENMVYSVIIEYFDSIGVYVNILPYLGAGQVVFYPSFIYKDKNHIDNERNVLFDDGELYYSCSRQEATEKAIEKANEILNKEL